MMKLWVKMMCISLFLAVALDSSKAQLHRDRTRELIKTANRNGPYLGVVIPNLFEMNPLLQHPSFNASPLVIDYAGRRFRFGTIEGKQVILVMTGLAMLNAGITTQLLLSEFDIEGVVHYGIAGNADPNSHIGDVTIPHYWSHTGLWSWQRHGLGPEDSLPLEAFGDYSRTLGSIRLADFATNKTGNGDNLLNSLWYQNEEVFPVDGTYEERQHIFWVPVDPHYYHLADSLKNLPLEGCINSTTCLDHTPVVKRVKAGTSTSIYLDNAAYRSFIYSKFQVTAVEMESAAVALVCHQHKKPFIVIRALSDLAGGGDAQSNEADLFTPLAATNSVKVAVEFIKLLSPAKARSDV